MKRLLVIILSFIVLTETITPCCLWDGCEQEQASTLHNDNNSKDGCCSPFAPACSTCVPGVDLPQTQLAELLVTQATLIHVVAPLHFHLSSFCESLYQPPRLA